MAEESKNKDLENSVLDANSKTAIELSLSDAVYNFRKDYVVAVAQQTAKFDIYSMSGALKYDRSELSRFVNEANVKPQIAELQKSYNPNDWYNRDPGMKNTDPLTQEVITESISENDFDIKKATMKFKKKYVASKVELYGIKKAAEVLAVNERTVRNHLTDYKFADNGDLTALMN